MAHKTFISYKYSESQDLRDRIIDAMGMMPPTIRAKHRTLLT